MPDLTWPDLTCVPQPPVVRGHQFQLHQYYIVTACNACQDSIRGISPQGYQCARE